MLALHPFRVLGGVAATPGFGQFGTEILWPPTTASRINKKSTPEHRVVKPTESEREAPEDEPSRNGGGGGRQCPEVLVSSCCPRRGGRTHLCWPSMPAAISRENAERVAKPSRHRKSRDDTWRNRK